ncbi:hypothetical protein CIW48_19840 [Methylobacterium sp. P1-11]|uniref:hypothetical protein n=1 Tax=Methylobacterium sp. P1-11 TaxID=2024616 RepID=UPI0011ECD618|nr:hypothetical protein [Methylobacterium sp. P1-11]KAA0122244.1 hypothetical protein CIW48_19840 [Methylobacterium sp. P1-11]
MQEALQAPCSQKGESMAQDRNVPNRSVRPLPESLNRLLLSDSNRPIEWIEDPFIGHHKPTVYDRVLWWFSVAAFGAAAFITSASMTVRLLR